MNTPQASDPRDLTAQTTRVTWIGLVVNVALSSLKLAVGWLGHSQAILADAVHSLSDLVTDVAVLLGVRFWAAPADSRHPYGHRRIETLVTTLIGGALLAVGLGIGYHSILTVREAHVTAPGRIALAGAALSIVLKEWLYRWTVAVGRRIQSPAVIANAWHHRSDALSSIPAFIAVGVAIVAPRFAFVDHLGALIVSVFIIKVSWDIMSPALADLTDRGGSAMDQDRIAAIARGIPGVQSLHALRSRRVGSGLYVDLHVLVNGRLSVRHGHTISEEVKRAILKNGPDVLDVVVHLEPADDGPESI